MIAGILATIALAGQIGGSVADDALVDGERVHFFLPPQVVSEGRTLIATWSGDGRYLITVTEHTAVRPEQYVDYFEKRKQSRPESQLGVDIVNVRNGTVKRVWSASGVPGHDADVAFFVGSYVAVATVTTATGGITVLRITCGTSKSETIETLQGMSSLGQDPTGKYVAVSQETPPSVRLIGKSGNVLPRQNGVMLSSWTRQGVPVADIGMERYLSITPGGGTRWVDGAPDLAYWEPEEGRIRVRQSSMAMPGAEHKVPLVFATVPGEAKSIAVALGARAHFHNASDHGVYFSIGEVNLFRPIIEISKAAFEEMLAREKRTEVMANLAQVGKAMMMYSGDHDDTFPDQDGVEDALLPYLASRSPLEGFVYSGQTALGGNPSQTEAGYTPCPGGRAVLYQDGHVVFVPG